MFRTEAVIKNEAGIHCRPSAIIISERAKYEGEVTVYSESGDTKLTSALELIMLGLQKGSKIQIEVNGPNEDSFAIQLVELFEKEFDFSID